MATLDVSVIIVSWNTRELLLTCVESILNGTHAATYEVIVVDNASSDGSVDAVRERFPGVRTIVNEDNLGFSRANNLAILASTSRYVCLVNSDVEIHDGCLDALCSLMDSDVSIGVAGPRVLWPDGTMQSTCRKLPSLWNNFCPAVGLSRAFPRVGWLSGEHMLYFAHDRRLEVDVLVGCLLMVRRAALATVGLLDERFFIYSEDVDWCQRFGAAGWKVMFSPEGRATHRGRSSSSRDPHRFSQEELRAVIQYWEKHRGSMSVNVLVGILLLRHGIRLAGVTLVGIVRPALRHELAGAGSRNRDAIRWLRKRRVALSPTGV